MTKSWQNDTPMPSDAELLDHVERLLCDAFKVEFHKIWLAPPDSGWNVGTTTQFDNDRGHLYSTGGGRGIRDALWNAIKNHGIEQDRETVQKIIEKLTK